MKNETERLVGAAEARRIIGVKSPTTLRAMVARGDLPPFIRRGNRNHQLLSDLQRYVERLAGSRAAAR